MTLMQENFRDWETPATALTLCVGTAIATITSVCVAWNHPLRAYASVAGLGLGIWGQVLVQADMRKNRRQKMVQVANDTIFDAGIEVYTTTTIQEMQPTRSGTYYQPDIPYVDESDVEALPEPQIELYNWEDIVYEANAFLVGGNPGSAKTTLVSGYIVPMLSRQKESEIIVCDPDAKVNNWEEKGYTRIVSDYEEIFQVLKAVAGEKEARKQKDWHHQIILIFDELNDCQAQWEAESSSKFKESVRYIKSLGNARKYGITPFIMMQNHLVETIGLKSKDRNQFAMILLCASARDAASQNWKQTDERWQWTRSQAYPAILTGSIITQLAVHPTHGHHTEFRKEGNAPENISKPVISSIETIEISSIINYQDNSSPSTEPKSNPSDFDLSKPNDPSSTSSPEQPNIYQLIIELAISNGGSCTAREVQQKPWGRKYKSDGIKVAFEALEREGKGKVEVNKVPGGLSVVFTVTPPK